METAVDWSDASVGFTDSSGCIPSGPSSMGSPEPFPCLVSVIMRSRMHFTLMYATSAVFGFGRCFRTDIHTYAECTRMMGARPLAPMPRINEPATGNRRVSSRIPSIPMITDTISHTYRFPKRRRDYRDYILYAALLLMPVDGTVFGIQMPYWSPISPILFLLYACTSWRHTHAFTRAYPATIPLLSALLAVSVCDWATLGFNAVYTPRTIFALVCAVATLYSLYVAFIIRKIPARTIVTVIIVAYGIAFAVGVFTWLGQPNHLHFSWSYQTLSDWYLRQYFISRPQFLFAEPSYIGMHVFGVLLPAYWLSRDKRLIVLIVTFTAGSILMGAGVRILLDTAVAATLCVIVLVPWRRIMRSRNVLFGTILAALALCVGGTLMIATNPRMQSLIQHGLLAGDSSMSARAFRSLAPLMALFHDGWRAVLGFGAGNLGTAIAAGYARTLEFYTDWGGVMTSEIAELQDPFGSTLNRAGNVFTMNAYVSFAAEFGIPMLLIGITLVIRHVSKHHAWNKTTVCWLILLAYLYLQFEAYAFYALPLFIWATSMEGTGETLTDEMNVSRSYISTMDPMQHSFISPMVSHSR